MSEQVSQENEEDWHEEWYKKKNTHVATAVCGACKDEMKSWHGGHFVGCKCGKSFIDQERWDARHVRLGGEAVYLGQLCPPNCQVHKES